jgi:ketosteroid isomerase-like protein
MCQRNKLCVEKLGLGEVDMDAKDGIERINAAWIEAYNRRDAAGCAATYVENAQMLAPNQSAVRGRKALEDFFQRWIDGSRGTHSNKMLDFGVDGDLAYEVATYEIEGTDKPDKGKFVQIFRRQTDGSWKTVLTIYNSDNPLPAGD